MEEEESPGCVVVLVNLPCASRGGIVLPRESTSGDGSRGRLLGGGIATWASGPKWLRIGLPTSEVRGATALPPGGVAERALFLSLSVLPPAWPDRPPEP